MKHDDDIRELARKAKAIFDALPPDEQRRQRVLQSLNFAWGNLQCSTNHRVDLDTFKRAMREKFGDEYPEGWEPA